MNKVHVKEGQPIESNEEKRAAVKNSIYNQYISDIHNVTDDLSHQECVEMLYYLRQFCGKSILTKAKDFREKIGLER